MQKIVLPLLFAMAAALLCGCVSESLRIYRHSESSIEFPDFRERGTVLNQSSIILHEVRISFELKNPPEDQRGNKLEPMFGPLPGPVERYAAGYPDPSDPTGVRMDPSTIHEFSYQNGQFLVDGNRYPAGRDSLLYILQERPGPFRFIFKGRPITILQTHTWKPALLYRPIRDTQKVDSRHAVTRILREELQVGPHRIIIFPDTDKWMVNQHDLSDPGLNISPGDPITIDRRGYVHPSG